MITQILGTILVIASLFLTFVIIDWHDEKPVIFKNVVAAGGLVYVVLLLGATTLIAGI